MEKEFKATRASRNVYLGYFEKYTLEQLNKVPAGFNNNLIWNIGHVIVSQQTKAYTGTGNTPLISQAMIDTYISGTKPERDVTQEEADEIKRLLISTVDKTEEDYNNGLLSKSFAEVRTGLGFMLDTIEDAIIFNNFHEGVHLGVMMGLRKFI